MTALDLGGESGLGKSKLAHYSVVESGIGKYTSQHYAVGESGMGNTHYSSSEWESGIGKCTLQY